VASSGKEQSWKPTSPWFCPQQIPNDRQRAAISSMHMMVRRPMRFRDLMFSKPPDKLGGFLLAGCSDRRSTAARYCEGDRTWQAVL
jgi:hypothetical protein